MDDNSDGKPDALRINMTLPLQPGEKIHQVKAMFVLEYMLQERVRVIAETAAFVDHDSVLAGGALELDGDLVMEQRHALPYTGAFQKLYTTDPLISRSSRRDMRYDDLLRRYARRNITTAFVARYPIWTPAEESASGMFQLNLNIRFPTKQPVLYVPPVSETLKFAWIQYYSLAIIVWVAVQACLRFIFRYQVRRCGWCGGVAVFVCVSVVIRIGVSVCGPLCGAWRVCVCVVRTLRVNRWTRVIGCART